jgi:hypothetical protein
MDYFESKLKNPLLFKRTLILIKLWCYYESGILGSNVGLLATYALEMLVIYIFNNYSETINNEMDAFVHFFKICKETNWEKYMLSLFGFCEIDSSEPVDYKGLLDKDDFSHFLKTFDKINILDKQNSKKTFTNKYFNIIDPIFNTNNLGKSVNFHNFSKIKKVFEIGYTDIQNIISLKQSGASPFTYLNSLLKLFHRSLSNSHGEILFQNLLLPKIVISTNSKKEITTDETIEKNSSFKDPGLGFFTVSDSSIRDLNKRFSNTTTVTGQDGKKEGNIYTTKEIFEFFTGVNNISPTNYEMYYDKNTIEKLFNEL